MVHVKDSGFDDLIRANAYDKHYHQPPAPILCLFFFGSSSLGGSVGSTFLLLLTSIVALKLHAIIEASFGRRYTTILAQVDDVVSVGLGLRLLLSPALAPLIAAGVRVSALGFLVLSTPLEHRRLFPPLLLIIAPDVAASDS